MGRSCALGAGGLIGVAAAGLLPVPRRARRRLRPRDDDIALSVVRDGRGARDPRPLPRGPPPEGDRSVGRRAPPRRPRRLRQARAHPAPRRRARRRGAAERATSRPSCPPDAVKTRARILALGRAARDPARPRLPQRRRLRGGPGDARPARSAADLRRAADHVAARRGGQGLARRACRARSTSSPRARSSTRSSRPPTSRTPSDADDQDSSDVPRSRSRSRSRSASPAPGSASALDVYAASSLREVFEQIDRAPTYNFAGSNVLQTQIAERRAAPTCSRRPARQEAAAALSQRQLRAARDVRDEQARDDRAGGQPRRRDGRSTACARAGCAWRSATPGVPIGAYTRSRAQAPRA